MTADTVTREDLVERWIVRSALETFLAIFFESGGYGPGVLSEVTREGDSLQEGLTNELSSPLFGKLWPDDDDLESTEYRLAEAKVDLLVARMFAELASAPADWALEQAAGRVGAIGASHPDLVDELDYLPNRDRVILLAVDELDRVRGRLLGLRSAAAV